MQAQLYGSLTPMLFSVVFLTDQSVQQLWIIYCCTVQNIAILKYLEGLLKALLKSGLKISPKKFQPFRTELQYIGKTILYQTIKNQTVRHTKIQTTKDC